MVRVRVRVRARVWVWVRVRVRVTVRVNTCCRVDSLCICCTNLAYEGNFFYAKVLATGGLTKRALGQLYCLDCPFPLFFLKELYCSFTFPSLVKQK